MPSLFDNLLDELGYRRSSFYREAIGDVEPSVSHLMRDARRARVRGTYFIRTGMDQGGLEHLRPAVHVAEADSVEEARTIHRHVWNQGTTPFLLVSLPGQIRVYTSFAYDADQDVGQVEKPLNTKNLSLREIAQRLRFIHSDSIDSGEIWRRKGQYLTKERRVDRCLLATLRSLSRRLMRHHHLEREVAHAVIGRFVYLHYLRERDILSDEWLAQVGIKADAVFTENATLSSFRRLADKVDDRFNGRIFPINWSAASAPDANAVGDVGRAFAGEHVGSPQMRLFRRFDFSFIPVELLSAIYEQFLHDEGKGVEQAAFYTSEVVADYLLTEVDTAKPLGADFKILDPSCGSGIFLVLSYRRLIEQQLRKLGAATIPPAELSRILTTSIFGVERNSEACLVTEFNLLLTLLEYVQPPELHAHQEFKFPELHNRQVFTRDFFDDSAPLPQNVPEKFDWVVGNPPWKELSPADQDEKHAVKWIQKTNAAKPGVIARYRTSEAFSWRVRDYLRRDGVAGLIVQATSLTNDQSFDYRRAFFSENNVHRITNFSNLAYVLFESAEEPAATLTFALADSSAIDGIVHFGPLLANQPAIVPRNNRRHRVPWVLTMSAAEMQFVSYTEARSGKGMVWKKALWANSRDRRAIERLRQLLPTTLGEMAATRNWNLTLGVQLRRDAGSGSDPNQDIVTIKTAEGCDINEARRCAREFGKLKVLHPKRLHKTDTRLSVKEEWLVKNRWGSFIRERGGFNGLRIVAPPHIFLWNEFAALSDQEFIFRHPKIGLSASRADIDWLRAISLIWTSSITPYYLFLELSSGWGISRSTIDLGDAREMRMPLLSQGTVSELAIQYKKFASEEREARDTLLWQQRLDAEVARILRIPDQVMMLAQEFKMFRLPLVKGKAPRRLMDSPGVAQLESYAMRLKSELDAFVERKRHRHRVDIISSAEGAVAKIALQDKTNDMEPTVSKATPEDSKAMSSILAAAEKQIGQWIYVRRSVRVFQNGHVYICKPANALEWTQSAALLDAADVIAEVAEVRTAI